MTDKQIKNLILYRSYLKILALNETPAFAGVTRNQENSNTISIISDKNDVQDIFSVNDNEFQSIFGVTGNEFRSIFGVNILNTAWLIYKNPNITAQKIAEKLSITKRSAENYFSKLKTAKYIKRIGSDKKGHWKVLMKRGTNKGGK